MSKKRIEEPSSKEIRRQLSETIEKEKIFFLFTGNSVESVLEGSKCVREKGFNLIGIDFKIPGAKDLLKSFKKQGLRNFGVFSASTSKETRTAINAGATFVFSTHLDKAVIRKCRKESVFQSAGAVTPTEVFNVYDLGADTVSLFPCGRMGGISWFVFLSEIFPKVKFIPTDEMSLFEAGQYLKAGAYAVAPIIDLGKVKEPYKFIKEFLAADQV